VSKELIQFRRKEQMQRLRKLSGNLLARHNNLEPRGSSAPA
jgi:hypothetical protein